MIYPFRRVFGALKASFVNEGLVALHDTHVAAKQRNPAFRGLSALVDFVFPISPLLRLAKSLDAHAAERGIHAACVHGLRHLGVSWQTEWPRQGREIILHEPVLIYGAHGSILTPVFIAAAIDRSDVRAIALSYLRRLGPNLVNLFLPIYATSSLSLRRAGRQGFLPRLAGWALGKLETPIERRQAKERNQATLIHASAHVRDGGLVFISPEPRPPVTSWRRGIGVLVSEIMRSGAERPPYLVPYRIHNASITGAFQIVSRNPLLRALGRHHYRTPARVVLGEPIPMADVVAAVGSDPDAITAYLEAHYENRCL